MPSLAEQSPPAISIHRHCMQDLLHAVLADEQQTRIGLLIPTGKCVEKIADVTQNLISSPASAIECIRYQLQSTGKNSTETFGIYYTNRCPAALIKHMISAFQSASGHKPAIYLRIDCAQPGRFDALLYSDAAHQHPLTFEMIEH